MDIFVSYAREDRGRVEPLVMSLEENGFSVWWDAGINPGDSFQDVIDEAIQKAGCVLVIWTTASIDSQWVKSEALDGLERDILVPVFLDDVRVPVAYRPLQGARLLGWPGGYDETEFQKLLQAIGSKLQYAPAVSLRMPAKRSRRLVPAIALLLAAAVAIVAAVALYLLTDRGADREMDLAAYFAEDPVSYRKYLLALDKISSFDTEANGEAIVLLKQVTDAVPSFARAHTKLCISYNALYGENLDSDLLRLAEASCQRAAAIDPDDAELNLALGLQKTDSGDLESARLAFSRVLETENPFHSRAFLGLGRVFRLQGNVFEAEASYKKALKLEPASLQALFSMGTFYYTQGMYIKAAQTYENYLELDPDSRVAYNNLGASYLLSGKFEKALNAWEESASSEAESNIGYALYLLGRYEEAVVYVQRSVDEVPSDHRRWGNLGEILRFMPGKEDEAAAALGRAIALAEKLRDESPDDGETLGRLAVYYSSLNRREPAEAMIELARENANNDVYVLFDIAVALHNLGRAQSSAIQLEQALELGYPRVLAEGDPLFKDLWRAEY